MGGVQNMKICRTFLDRKQLYRDLVLPRTPHDCCIVLYMEACLHQLLKWSCRYPLLFISDSADPEDRLRKPCSQVSDRRAKSPPRRHVIARSPSETLREGSSVPAQAYRWGEQRFSCSSDM